MVSPNPNPTVPDENSQAHRQLAARLAEAAMIMGGFNPTGALPPAPRFELGRTFATAAVAHWAERDEIDLSGFMRRHHSGDWGDLDEDDKQANEDALSHGGRIFSCYLTKNRKIYVITEADRSSTTILFAEEY